LLKCCEKKASSINLELIKTHEKSLTTYRTLLAITHDIGVIVVAWIAAYVLRFNFNIPSQHFMTMLETLLLVLPFQLIVFILFGLYRGIWRFASVPDLKRIMLAVGVSALIITTTFFMVRGYIVVPRSVLILNPILLVVMMGGSRFIYRAWREHKDFGATFKQGEPVIVLGAGDAAISLVKDLARSSQWRVVGLLDDDKHLIGREMLGVKVLGDINSLARYAEKFGIAHVIMAMPSANHVLRKKRLS